MKTRYSKNLMYYNQLDSKIDRIYHDYLSVSGFSLTTMWILYSAYTSERTPTQSEICETWRCSPQTINSALKVLEKKEIVQLNFAAGNRKNKYIHLTDRGMELCEQLVEPLIEAENLAFSVLTVEEQENLIALFQKYSDALDNEIQLHRKGTNYDTEAN